MLQISAISDPLIIWNRDKQHQSLIDMKKNEYWDHLP